MNDHPADADAVGKRRRTRANPKGFVLLAVVSFVWIGLRIWDSLSVKDPFRLIRFGNVAERIQGALELRTVTPGWSIEDAFAALIRGVEDPDAGVRAMAAQSLGELAARNGGPPGSAAEAPGAAEKRRYSARLALTKALTDHDANVRATATTGLGWYGMRDQLPTPPELIAALNDESAIVRAAAVRSLWRFARAPDWLIPRFLSMLENDEEEVHRACDETLGSARPTPALVPKLIDILRSRDREVRCQSARLLGRIGAEAQAAVPSLIRVLKEPIAPEMSQTKVAATEWDPSGFAAIALGQIATSEAVIAALTETLSDGIPEQRGIPERRLCAAEALGQIGPRAASAAPALIVALDELLDSEQERPGANTMIVALGQIAPNSSSAKGAVTTLIRVLGSSRYRSASVGAAEALTRFGRDSAVAVPKLRALAEDHSSFEKTRDEMREALDAIERASGPPSVISPAR